MYVLEAGLAECLWWTQRRLHTVCCWYLWTGRCSPRPSWSKPGWRPVRCQQQPGDSPNTCSCYCQGQQHLKNVPPSSLPFSAVGYNSFFWCKCLVKTDSWHYLTPPRTVQDVRQEPSQEAQRCEAKGEEAQVPPVHSSGPEGREVSSAHGLGLRPTPPAAAALPAAADPQPAEARSHTSTVAAVSAARTHTTDAGPGPGSAAAARLQLPAPPTDPDPEVSHRDGDQIFSLLLKVKNDIIHLKKHCVVSLQIPLKFNIYNINEVIIQTFIHKWLNELFSEENMVRHIYTKVKQCKLCCPIRPGCLFSLFSHGNKEGLII